MGLFSQALHVYRTSPEAVRSGLVEALASLNWVLSDEVQMSPDVRDAMAQSPRPGTYAIGPQEGNWVTVIDFRADPWPSEVGKALSHYLQRPVFVIMVHDDDVLFYNYEEDGISKDGYNSNPQYFEKERLSGSEVEAQRHAPEALGDIVPARKSIADFKAILECDWWFAYDAGRLDEDGVMSDEDYDNAKYVFEGDRMTDIGTFLELAGPDKTYPNAAWFDDPRIEWDRFTLLYFAKQNGR